MTSPLLDPTTLRNLVDLDDGGTGLLREMITIFREDTPRRLHEILAAAAAGNAQAMGRAAHALKGGSGALGAEALRSLAAELEARGHQGDAAVEPELATRLEAIFTQSLAALESHAASLERS